MKKKRNQEPKIIIHLIAAARPNFMKIAPLYHALKKERWALPVIVHTGQHYDINMSEAFFQDLGLPDPDIHLGVGSGSHAEQTGQVMIAYEKILMECRPDMVIVVGDVNSTMACTIAASKMSYSTNNPADIKNASNSTNLKRPIIAHLEAGLRSFDRTMPEEINRLVTDSLADILWTPSPDGDENLLKEGVPKNKILRVGNIMLDSFEMLRKKIEEQAVFKEFSLSKKNYGVVTLHRPSNVDNQEIITSLCRILSSIGENIPLLFPLHPRTRKNLERYNLLDMLDDSQGIILAEPISYIRFMNLVCNCRFVITDSGGIQEETTYLGIPCLTIRPNTERPITIAQGTNRLCKPEDLEEKVETILSGKSESMGTIEFWDGKTASRLSTSIKTLLL